MLEGMDALRDGSLPYYRPAPRPGPRLHVSPGGSGSSGVSGGSDSSGTSGSTGTSPCQAALSGWPGRGSVTLLIPPLPPPSSSRTVLGSPIIHP